MKSLVLASKSAARAALLSAAGVPFEAVAVAVDEAVIKAQRLDNGDSPAQIADALADEKALAVSRRRSGLIIGCDQTLDFGGRLFDKAESLGVLRLHLTTLSGQTHQLHSAVSLAEDGEIVWRHRLTARLTMRPFSDGFLECYLERNGDRLLSCVGGYELEGEGVQLFERIEGDYFGILGLPLLDLLGVLRARGAITS